MPSPVLRVLRYAEKHSPVRPTITTVMPSTAKTSDEDRWQRALQHSHRRHEQNQSGQPQRLRHMLLCHALSILPRPPGRVRTAGQPPPSPLDSQARIRDSSRGSGVGKDLAASHSQPRSIGDLPANAHERPSLAVSNARSARARTAAVLLVRAIDHELPRTAQIGAICAWLLYGLVPHRRTG
jgi:hypothetical protein